MYISEYLRESIASGNIIEIRGALLGYVDADPAFKSQAFEDAVNYVSSKKINVFEEHDPRYQADAESNQERYYQIKMNLRCNFSQERIQELMAVGRLCMKDDPVYKVTGSSLNNKQSGYEEKPFTKETDRRTAPQYKTEQQVRIGDDSSKKANGQNQRVVVKRTWVMAALVAVLAVIILLIIRR